MILLALSGFFFVRGLTSCPMRLPTQRSAARLLRLVSCSPWTPVLVASFFFLDLQSMAKMMDPLLPILSMLGYWAIILVSSGGPGWNESNSGVHIAALGFLNLHLDTNNAEQGVKWGVPSFPSKQQNGNEFPPGPPKEPKIVAQYPNIESIGSIGSIILAILWSSHMPGLPP